MSTVLTVGHSTLPIEMFLDILRQNSVRLLVDIRTIPKSRHNPQFAQESLAASLGSVSIEYRWEPALGGLRRSREDSPNMGWRNTSFRGYADYMQTAEFAAAIDELIAQQDTGPVALMCAEAVPWRCHRSLVADALTVRGISVEDIFYDSRGASHRKPHALTSFARVDGTRVWYPPENDLFAAMPPTKTNR
jgi:uncharacterized protein (DUF488 family)